MRTSCCNWRTGAGGYNLEGIRETLIGKAADTAVNQMVARLIALYPTMPGQRTPLPAQPSSTTITAQPAPSTILIALPDKDSDVVGDRYGVYRGDQMVAEVQIMRLAGTRAQAKVVSQNSPIQPTDLARKMPTEIRAQ